MTKSREELMEELFEMNEPHTHPKIGGRGQLHFTIGLARSGKSTFCSKWVCQQPRECIEGFIHPRVVVCADNIRLAVTGQRYNRHAESTVFMIKNYMIESLLSRGHDVIVDGTHSTISSVQRLLEIDPNAQYHLINTSAEVCKQRAIATNQEDLIPVIDRHAGQLKVWEHDIDGYIQHIKEQIKTRWSKS